MLYDRVNSRGGNIDNPYATERLKVLGRMSAFEGYSKLDGLSENIRKSTE